MSSSRNSLNSSRTRHNRYVAWKNNTRDFLYKRSRSYIERLPDGTERVVRYDPSNDGPISGAGTERERQRVQDYYTLLKARSDYLRNKNKNSGTKRRHRSANAQIEAIKRRLLRNHYAQQGQPL